MLTDDAVVSMPPEPEWHQRRRGDRRSSCATARRGAGGRGALCRPAPTASRRSPTTWPTREGFVRSGLLVVGVRADGIASITRFGGGGCCRGLGCPSGSSYRGRATGLGFAKHRPGDDLALNLRRALVDPGGAHVAVQVLERMTLLERDRAVELDCGVDRLLGDLGREQLGHRRERRVVRALRRAPAPPGGRAAARPRSRPRARRAGGRPPGARRAACRTYAGAACKGRQLERRARHPDRERAHAGAEQVERAHGYAKARSRARPAPAPDRPRTPSNVSEPIAWGVSSCRRSPLSPGASPGIANAVSPRAPPSG